MSAGSRLPPKGGVIAAELGGCPGGGGRWGGTGEVAMDETDYERVFGGAASPQSGGGGGPGGFGESFDGRPTKWQGGRAHGRGRRDEAVEVVMHETNIAGIYSGLNLALAVNAQVTKQGRKEGG